MSNIKINDVPQRIQYLATAGQTQFSIPFPFFQNSYVIVWQDGVQIFQGAAPGQYLITGAGSPSGGQITLVTPALINSIITIQGEMPIDRTSIYSATISNLTGSDLNGDFNREVVMMKQIQTTQQFLQLQYAPWELVSQDPTVTRDRYLPILAPQQVFRMNEAGTAFEAYTLDNVPAPSNSYFLTYGDDPSLENEQNLALLGNGILKQTVSGGLATLALAIPGVDYLDPSSPLGTMAYQDANNVNITGGAAALTSGSVLNSPVTSIDLVNKAYADSIAAGFTFKASAVVATTANLNATYANGASGVGATLTSNVNGALSIDGVSPTLNDRILVKNQSTTYQNGVYVATDLGSAGTPYILTRATDFDSPAEIQPGSIVFIQDGTTQADTSFVETEIVFAVGTSPILFTQFSQQYPLSMGNGGSGASIVPVNNSLVYSNASNLTLLAPQNSMVLTSSIAGAPTWATTLPANLTIPTPRIAQINDANGNAIFSMVLNAAAVNYWAINNTPTTFPIQMGANGSDTNIGIEWSTKGTGQFAFYSKNITTPFVWHTGATNQHTTSWAVPNTAASRTVTLQDADGTMAYLIDRGWVPISTATANNTSATMIWTDLTGYSSYALVLNLLTPTTNGANILWQASINNGSSYLSSAGDYFYQAFLTTGTSTVTSGSAAGTAMVLETTGLGSTVGGGCSGINYVFGVTSSSSRKGFTTNNLGFNSSSAMQVYATNGQIVNTNAINALRIITSSGNLFSGTATLYGIK